MLYEVLGDIWVVERNPYLQDDLLDNPKRRAQLIAAMQHRLGEVEKRRDGADAARDAKVGELLRAAAQAVQRFERQFADFAAKRKRAQRLLARHTRADNVRFDAFSRVSHVTDATDWRVELPFVVLMPDSEAEIRAAGARLHRLGLTHHSARRRHRLYGRSGAPDALVRGHQHREARDLGSGGEPSRCRGTARPAPAFIAPAGVVTKRVSETAERAGYVFAVDPTSADASCIGGNIAMNAGGKKAVLWGTAVDNLAWWRMVDAQGNWLEVTRLNHNLGKIHDVAVASFELLWKDGTQAADQAQILRREQLDIAGAKFRKLGLGKDVTDKFLGGLPGVQKEGCDGLITARAGFCIAMPSTRARCAWSSSATRATRSRASSRSAATCEARRRAAGNPPATLLAGLEHLDDRYLHAVGYTTKSKRGGAAENGAVRRHRRRRCRCRVARPPAMWCAWPTRAPAKASSR